MNYFVKRLNDAGVWPWVSGGKVIGLECSKGDLTREQVEALGLNPDDCGCVEAHPDGADRGGYRPVVWDWAGDGECAAYTGEGWE